MDDLQASFNLCNYILIQIYQADTYIEAQQECYIAKLIIRNSLLSKPESNSKPPC